MKPAVCFRLLLNPAFSSTRHFVNRYRTLTAALLAVLAVLANAPAQAGRYELIKGKGVEVCEVYGRNLNASGEIWPMNCERKVSPAFEKEGLTKPVWQKLKADKYFDLVVDIDKLLNPAHYRNEDQLKQNIADLRVRAEQSLDVRLVKLDINHDGRVESVVKFSYGCAPPGSGGWWATSLIVADSSLRSVDLPTTRPLLQNETTNLEKYPAGGWRYVMYDVFLFKGRSYFDRWSDVKADTDILKVFLAEGNRTSEICVYQYR